MDVSVGIEDVVVSEQVLLGAVGVPSNELLVVDLNHGVTGLERPHVDADRQGAVYFIH